MQFSRQTIRNERQLKAITGLPRKAFDTLLEEFSKSLESLQQDHYQRNQLHRKRRPGGGRKGGLPTPEIKLFFILFYLKNYPTFDVLGFLFDLSPGKAKENVQRLLPVLKRAEERLQVLPHHRVAAVFENHQPTGKTDKVIIDATERPRHRPHRTRAQKRYYSGKKRRHTLKNTVVSDSTTRVLAVGKTVPGSQHDYSLLNQELPRDHDWFQSVEVWVDLGYQGIKSDYTSPDHIHIPHKKPRASKRHPTPMLTKTQKRENRQMRRIRVAVEDAIGGMKNFQVLATRLRARLNKFADEAILLVAGLWNLKISYANQ